MTSKVEDGRLVSLPQVGLSFVQVKAAYHRDLDKAESDMEVGFWIVEHKTEYAGKNVVELRRALEEDCPYSIEDLLRVMSKCDQLKDEENS